MFPCFPLPLQDVGEKKDNFRDGPKGAGGAGAAGGSGKVNDTESNSKSSVTLGTDGNDFYQVWTRNISVSLYLV